MSDLGECDRWCHRLSVIAGATNPAMISSTLVADVTGAPNNPISPITMSHMGTIHTAARLDSADIDHNLVLWFAGDPSPKEAGVSRPRLTTKNLRGDLDLDLLGPGFLAQRQQDRQQAALVLGADLPGVDCWR
jgi:hypothetical protein